MKRRIVLSIAAAVCVAGIATFFAFGTRSTRPQAALPNPNGYDDFAAATSWLVNGGVDLRTLAPEELRSVVEQNAKALETVRSGLKKQSAVPVRNSMNWFNQHITQVGARKSLAQFLVAEGLVHLHEGRTNEAARSFANCIAFGHSANRGGLMIDELVGIACQAIGAERLVQVAPHVSPDMAREIVSEFAALDQAREPTSAILQRDKEWSWGAYGLLRGIWSTIAQHRTLRDSEARFEKQRNRSISGLRLVMTDMAVRGYTAKNGKPPANLTELVPAWLPAVPLDPFSNGSLVYRMTTNSFLLYSLGPNEKDDQGTPFKRGATETGDLLPTAF